jgi:uridine kinase
MQEYEITVVLSEEECQEIIAPQDMTLKELAEEYQEYYSDQIILAMFNGKLRELSKRVDRSGTLSFVTVAQRDGRKTYRRSVTLLLQKAVEKLYGSDACLKVMHSLGEGYYCQIILPEQPRPCGENCEGGTGKLPITEQELERIKSCMQVLTEQDLPITKHSLKTEDAEALFREKGMHDKERLFHYRRSSRVNLYNLDGVEDYFYGYMAPSTGMLKYYDLAVYEDDFVLLFPGAADTRKVEPLDTSNKLFHVLKDSREWSRMLGIGTVGALNDAIAQGKGQDIILLQEALMEEKIGNLAQQIASDPKKKFVMIAGPSSSGKTSFANRLSIQLTAKGLKPHAVSLDDYYADREFCPKNPDGSYDFECLEALDVKQFNEDMTRLLAGETVQMPTFDFVSGKHSYNGRKLRLEEGDVLVIEGIHGLNDRLSYTLPAESKFKIYISALTHLNIDEHSLLPTTDTRLIRRIVRDARTRGTSAQNTIAMWPSVRRGEEKNIFPFQESADVMFNSALVYELAVLKVYAEPLLFQIPRDSAEYLEAKRLLKFLDYFLPLPTEGISKNSLLREFVGGSCFHV